MCPVIMCELCSGSKAVAQLTLAGVRTTPKDPRAFDALDGVPHRFSRDRFLCTMGNADEMGPQSY